MQATFTLTNREQLLKPSSAFKQEAGKALFAIIAFIIVYVLLFLMALALAAACIFLGVFIVTRLVNWISLLLGGGFVGLGVMVCIFLVKFIFEKTKEDVTDSIEVTAAEQPALVEFIHAIAKETGTARPKKIFISHDVNASVFYNSSFWSMFLPVKKNLKIGLGLVNAINISEFKAVLAHEFGHFSQRSMKVGSFVYNVNRIIFNMLFKNTGYSNTLQGFANVHAVFAIFAQITAKIVQAIQWVLRQMYSLVNIRYMGLSRQMEFHADLVAASVSGSNNIVSSLKRIDLADSCFQATLNTYDKLWKENKRASNIYEDHRTVLGYVAQTQQYELVGGLPVLPKNDGNENHQRVNIKDQWASHPSTAEREAYLNKYNLQAAVDDAPAWSLIQNAARLKEELTQHIYRNIDAGREKLLVDNATFDAYYQDEMKRMQLPPVFGTYYDNRTPAAFVPSADNIQQATTFDAVFTPEVKQLPGLVKALENDIAVLKAIDAKEINTRTFDFDGTKQDRSNAASIKTQLETELQQKQALLAATDKTIFQFFYNKALAVGPTAAADLSATYEAYFSLRKEADEYLVFLQQLMELMQPLYNTLGNEQIVTIIKNIKKEEVKLKANLAQWQQRGAFAIDATVNEEVTAYIKSNHAYFSGNSYFDNELKQLNTVIQDGWAEVHWFVFGEFRSMLEKMEGSV